MDKKNKSYHKFVTLLSILSILSKKIEIEKTYNSTLYRILNHIMYTYYRGKFQVKGTENRVKFVKEKESRVEEREREKERERQRDRVKEQTLGQIFSGI